MSKKSKRKSDPTKESPMTTMPEMREQETPPAPITKPPPKLTSELLMDVRNAALKASSDAAHNIAELESWRNEIDATIAYLRAQRK